MATTTITPIQLVKNTPSVSIPVGSMTAIVAANEHKIAYPQEGKLLIVLNNTTAAAKNFTIKAGSSAFVASRVGDLVFSIAQNEVRYLVVSSDRFLDAAGNVVITVESGTTGFIGAFYMP